MSPVTSSLHEIDTSKDNTYSTSILIANLSSPVDYHVLESAVRNATRSTKDRLVVILHSMAFANQGDLQANWFEIQRLLTWTYVESTAVAQDMDKVLLDMDVLLRPPHIPAAAGSTEDKELIKEADALYVFKDDSDTFSWWIWRSSNPIYISEPTSWSGSHIPLPPDADKVKPSFPIVALGGTFDHLHAGHKILLSMAAWIARKKVIVGVTDDNLLVNKANKHVLESLARRADRVRSFLTSFKPGLEYDIVPIQDVYGPTTVDPNIQALVVSKETLSGGAASRFHSAGSSHHRF
ncbi:Nucleotidylyl transferase [Thelephora ganbajun]|uniref:Nucleotidylyl transferase n=1 Tax=Thelephora ganbajun TaxID=370292 RepID=A0ACB6Z685_THEGA|nr:Nucleotidylyl transferase [Thelephora ganbajun]